MLAPNFMAYRFSPRRTSLGRPISKPFLDPAARGEPPHGHHSDSSLYSRTPQLGPFAGWEAPLDCHEDGAEPFTGSSPLYCALANACASVGIRLGIGLFHGSLQAACLQIRLIGNNGGRFVQKGVFCVLAGLFKGNIGAQAALIGLKAIIFAGVHAIVYLSA